MIRIILDLIRTRLSRAVTALRFAAAFLLIGGTMTGALLQAYTYEDLYSNARKVHRLLIEQGFLDSATGLLANGLGAAATTSLTFTTDGTGDGEIVLPAGSIGAAEETYAGRAQIVICGDPTTVNNNTVYYGPVVTVNSSDTGGMDCDVTALGNATEATADAPVFTSKAFQVRGMICRSSDLDATVSFTLRSAAAATTPSVTCSIADGVFDCVADIQTTVEIAAGATIAIAVASTADQAADSFVCTIDIAY